MAITTLWPDAAGDICNILEGSPLACPNHWDNINDDPPAGWIASEATPAPGPLYSDTYDLYNLPDSGITDAIQQIEVFFRCRAQNTPITRDSAKATIKTGGVPYGGTGKTVTTAYVTYSQVWVQNPQTETYWTIADIDALQIGVALRRCSDSGVSKRTYCQQVWVEITHIPAALALRSYSYIIG